MKHGRTSSEKVPFAVAAILAVALGGCQRQAETPAPPGDDAASASIPKTPVDPATAGSVSGVVKFDGTPPQMRAINMSGVPNCAKLHSSPAMTEDVVPGDNGTLQNVVVYLKGDFRTYAFEVPRSPAAMDQQGCIYAPHVLALMAGQPLQVANSDGATHNVHAVPKANRGWNESEPAGAAAFTETFAQPEIGIPVKCNIHAWMKAYISVFSNPYFQVTGKDGSFRLVNIPPGTYSLAAWHEVYGTKEVPVTIQAKQEQTATITFTDQDHP